MRFFRLFFFFSYSSSFPIKCLLRMRKRRKSNLIQILFMTDESFWRQCANVIDNARLYLFFNVWKFRTRIRTHVCKDLYNNEKPSKVSLFISWQCYWFLSSHCQLVPVLSVWLIHTYAIGCRFFLIHEAQNPPQCMRKTCSELSTLPPAFKPCCFPSLSPSFLQDHHNLLLPPRSTPYVRNTTLILPRQTIPNTPPLVSVRKRSKLHRQLCLPIFRPFHLQKYHKSLLHLP